MLTKRLPILFLAPLCGLLANCNSSNPYGKGVAMTDEGTLYLDGLHLPIVQPHNGMPVDNVSYWDGDSASGSPAITIDLTQQRAFYFKGNSLVGVSRISSGTEEHRTPAGRFKVTEKDIDHRSNLYGDFVDAAGNVVVAEVDVKKDKPPRGTKFLGARMDHFMRFNGGIGMHTGFLPGYAASHGCIRMPDKMAKIFYQNTPHGTPVTVVE